MKIYQSATRQQRSTPTHYNNEAPTFRGFIDIKGRNINNEPTLRGT